MTGRLLSGQRVEESLARLLATSALFRRQAAVLMVLAMPLALRGAGSAGRKTGLERAALRRWVGIGLAAHDPKRRVAGVGAVEAQADATGQVADIVLGKAGVRADRAARLAGAALLDAPRQHAQVDGLPWVCPENRVDLHGASAITGAQRPSSARGCSPRRAARA